jgi:hypothetical protein
MKRISFLGWFAAALFILSIMHVGFAQSRPPHPVQVLVSPDKADWNYKVGEEATFRVTVLKHQVPLKNAAVTIAIGPEKMPAVYSGTVTLKEGTGIAGSGKLKEPGFLRCEATVKVDGITYRGLATAGFEAESIRPTQVLPADFREFWDEGVYNDLLSGALRNYMFMNLDDRDNYYFKRVYLGCVRALDFLTSLPEYDGSNLAVWGGSQGGALSIVTAALDDRVKFLVSMYPALSDLTGYLHGRAGGWPHMFTGANKEFTNKKDKIAVSAYYDVVNFARYVNVPGFYTWGYNDETCPPTSYYAAYNLITAPKELYLVQETGHWTFPEQHTNIQDWLLKQLK